MSDRPSSRRGFRDSSLVQLTLVRFREFIREPEAVFWTFIFPVLLAAGLGIAFRQRGPDRIQIGVVGDSSARVAVTEALKKDSALVVRSFDDSAGARALRTGKVALLVRPGTTSDSVRYIYDRQRSDAVSARVEVDRAVQHGAGQIDPIRATDSYITEKGSRYIDFLIPGLLGMNLMGSSIWGLAFSIVTARSKKLLKRLMATPMSRVEYLFSFLASRLVFLILEVVTLLGFGYLAFGVPFRGSLVTLFIICLVGAVSFGGLGLLTASRAHDRSGVGHRQLHHAADVDLLRRFLLVGEFPGRGAAFHQAAAAHRGERRAPREHARGRIFRRHFAGAAHHPRLGRGDVLRGSEAVSLAVG
jgi:hypothetical protein